ncbi:MAG: bifunctional UDP-sugar hydrolase/5'-nucleotidase [Bacilli bacterium]|nr:bifunctional UDP-sugar hydrolase/5'-nucleotidase [Bacilli bacterium]
MKNRHLLLIISILVLSSCVDFSDSSFDSSSESGSFSSDSFNSETSNDISSNTSSDRPTSGTEIVDFYAVNDFHGAISFNSYFDEPGLARVATYLKDKKDDNPDNAVIISSGDMWQGSYESYHNKGRVVTDVMNDIGFDTMTIGNHEFDWGIEDIVNNVGWAEFPLLGANIMEYPDTSTKSSIGEEYAIINRGHLKIGIIGVIGQGQITSINSRFMQDIYFEEPTQIIKNLSVELRQEHNVDIVVLSIHAGQDEVDNSIPKGKYVDAVFCSHTHSVEQQTINGVPFIQGGYNGKYVSNIKLSYNYATGIASHISSQNTYEGQLNNLTPDTSAQTIIDKYAESSDIRKNEAIGTLTDNLDRYSTLPNMANYAAAMKAVDNGYDIDFAMTNFGRSDIPAGPVTYGDLFKGLPFDNYVYIVEATGRNIKSQASFNYIYIYRVKDYSYLDNSTYYTIAVIDYVVLHQNISKEYNYFTDYDPEEDYVGYLHYSDTPSFPLFPRDLISEAFENAPNNIINPYDYTGSRYSDLTT